jgi:phosphonate transport system substrate-binding protein
MKKLLILSTLLILSGCAQFFKEEVASLTFVIAPTAITSELESAAEIFSAELKAYLYDKGYDVQNIQFEVTKTHQEASDALVSQKLDFGFIPVLEYLEHIDSMTVLATGMQEQFVRLENVEDYNASSIETQSKVISPSRRSLIYTGPSQGGQEIYSKFQNNSLTWIDLNTATWCHIVVTDMDGYIYPSLWLIDEYERRMGELYDHILAIKGYPDVMAMLADESCDIAVGPDSLRQDYAIQWRSAEAYNRSASIFSEVNVIGITQEIYDDVFVVRNTLEEDVLSDELIQHVQDFITLSDRNHALDETLGFKAYQVNTEETYLEMIDAYEYIDGIMN